MSQMTRYQNKQETRICLNLKAVVDISWCKPFALLLADINFVNFHHYRQAHEGI